VFTESLLRNGLHNPVVPPLLGADDIEKTVSSIVACWTVFTELLPGKSLIKSVTIFTILGFTRQNEEDPITTTNFGHDNSCLLVVLISYGN
jgi:hypothetical protein